jgi:hypothetical protein
VVSGKAKNKITRRFPSASRTARPQLGNCGQLSVIAYIKASVAVGLFAGCPSAEIPS